MQRGARMAYLIVAWLFVVCCVIQFFLAGLGIFENGTRFETHRDFGYLFGWLGLFLVILALLGRLPRRQFVGGSLLVLLLFFMQSVFVLYRTSVPFVAALHPLNGALILGISLVLAMRARRYVAAPLGVAIRES
jgi:mercuric ion transport protein